MLSLHFYGVRGSTPSCDPEIIGYGGNTSCVLVSSPGLNPIILDLGTGLRSLGLDLMAQMKQSEMASLTATALVTHLHWDHIQGLPFFAPILQAGSNMEIVGPPPAESGLEAAVREFLRPPLFPVTIESLPGELTFTEAADTTLTVGGAEVTVFPVPHLGATNGYRIDLGVASVAYIPDHQQPTVDPRNVPADVVAHCQGVDVLIHDAQYDSGEFANRATWGHCTAEFAVALAAAANAKRLVLFHHDPSHNDSWIEESVARAQAVAPPGLTVLAAAEGMTLTSGLSALAPQ